MVSIARPMRALFIILSALYVISAADLLYLAYRVVVRSCTEGQLTFDGWVLTLSVAALPFGLALVYSALAYLWIALRHRKIAITLAAISCVGIPYGTALGIATLVALFWPGTASRFRHVPSSP